jgi:hypothetical protein
MHFTRKISFNFEAELPKNFLINPPSTYTRVSNFGQNMDFKTSTYMWINLYASI